MKPSTTILLLGVAGVVVYALAKREQPEGGLTTEPGFPHPDTGPPPGLPEPEFEPDVDLPEPELEPDLPEPDLGEPPIDNGNGNGVIGEAAFYGEPESGEPPIDNGNGNDNGNGVIGEAAFFGEPA